MYYFVNIRNIATMVTFIFENASYCTRQHAELCVACYMLCHFRSVTYIIK